MDLKSKFYFILDFDGTIVNSFALHERAFRAALQEYSVELEKKFCYGDHLGYSTQMITQRIGLEDSDGIKVTARKHEFYEAYVKDGRLTYMPGAEYFINTLRRLKIKRFLATAGSRRSVNNALASLSLLNYFDDIVTVDDVRKGKPAPDVHHILLERNKLSVNSCVVVEDSVTGVIASRSAGIDVIGAYNLKLENRVDLFVDDLYKLAQLL
jgi:HAD superfamily hydrolase (TIGR01509 family)